MTKLCCIQTPRPRRASPPYGGVPHRAGVGNATDNDPAPIVLRRSRSSSVGETSPSPRVAAPRARRSHSLEDTGRGNDADGLGFLFEQRSSKRRLDVVANRKAMLAWKREQEAKEERERAETVSSVVASRNPDDVRTVKKREISDNALLSGFRPQMEREYDRLVYEEGAPGPLEEIAQQAIANVFANADGSVNAVREGHGGFMRR